MGKLMSGWFDTLIREFRSGSYASQQSLGHFLGVLDYNAYPHDLPEALECLLESVSPSVCLLAIIIIALPC